MSKKTELTDKQLFKAIQRAVDKRANKEIVPIVKKAYAEQARKDLGRMKEKSSAKGVKKDSIAKEAKHISGKIASYVSNTEPTDGKFIIFNSLPPSDPLWGQINSQALPGDLFAEWLVNGELVIHPSLTKYRGKNINDDIGWEKYVKDYRFEAVPFMDNLKENLQKNYNKKIADIVADAITKEIQKKLK